MTEQTQAHARRKLGLDDEAPLPGWVEQLAHHPAFLMDMLNGISSALLKSTHLDPQSAWCVAVAMGHHLAHGELLRWLVEMARAAGVTNEALNDAVAICASTVGFNMQHAFRGYVQDQRFDALRVGLRRSVTTTPWVGHDTAHLIGVVISVHSGCRRCVQHHTRQALNGDLTPDHINQAMQIGAIIASVCSVAGPR